VLCTAPPIVSIPLQTGLVYGPLASRRLGRSLGVNLLPENRKICNFNCPYCQYGWTPAGTLAGPLDWPAPIAVARAVEAALGGDPAIDSITLAGNGEPTLHPGFGEVVERLRAVRDRLAPAARIAVLSNSSTVGRPGVIAALRRLDGRYMKLDAGDEATMRRVNGTRLDAEGIVSGLSRLDDVVLQAMFVRGPSGVDNTTPAALQPWLDAVIRIRPSAVHVYSLDRPAASIRLERVPRATLEQITERVGRAGIKAEVF
jgi:wyosine [tRNA(Phe)-imidazoG37] synthetase (radical SAM superfamily)